MRPVRARFEWTSVYGSLIVSGYEISTTDGMNEEGLVVNLQWEVNATYPEDDGATQTISLSVFPQYLLDRYATVAEAVADLRENPVLVQGGAVPVGPPGRAATVHISMSGRQRGQRNYRVRGRPDGHLA